MGLVDSPSAQFHLDSDVIKESEKGDICASANFYISYDSAALLRC